MVVLVLMIFISPVVGYIVDRGFPLWILILIISSTSSICCFNNYFLGDTGGTIYLLNYGLEMILI